MIKFLSVAVLFAAAAVAPALSAEQRLHSNDEGQVIFVTPSHNIGCIYTPEGGTSVYEPAGGGPELICERVEPKYITVILTAEGKPDRIVDPGEQSCCGLDQELRYGNYWQMGPFTCLSRKSGLLCENEEGHGFSMARAGVNVH